MDWINDILLHLQGQFSWLVVDGARLTEPEMLSRLVVQVILLFGSAYFSGSETALFSLSRLDLQRLRREEHPHAGTLYRLLEQPRRLIISILCGNEIINVASAANMATILVSLYGEHRAEILNILVMVPLLLLFGEVTPKTIAVSNPVRISANLIAPPMSIWVWLITPVRELIRLLADRITTWIVGEQKAPENLLRVDELSELVDEALEEGGMTPATSTLVHNLLDAGATEIVEIMTPRTETAFVDADLSVTEVMERLRQYRYNRLPAFRGVHDNFIGFIHAEDFIPFASGVREPMDSLPAELIHQPIVVPPTKKVDEMFDFFRDNDCQAAIVLDEFGGVSGMITMKAVLRFIFSHLTESVSGQHLYTERDQNRYLVPGDMHLVDFNQLTRFGLEDPRMTTVAGILFRHLDRLPQVGDSVTFDGVSLTVHAMDGHRISQVEARLGQTTQKSELAAGEETS